MHLRAPFVVAAVLVAAAAAGWRATQHAPAASSLTRSETETPPPTAAAYAARRRTRDARAADDRIVVYVAGEVRHSGIYKLAPSARAVDALAAAGGATSRADLIAVDLAQPLNDGDEVAVPAVGDPVARVRRHSAHRKSSSHRKKHGRRHHHQPAEDPGPAAVGDGGARMVDLNAASEEDLETLPGVGATLAERIVAFREASGPFASTDDLLDVAGVTQAKFEALTPYVTVTTTNKESVP